MGGTVFKRPDMFDFLPRERQDLEPPSPFYNWERPKGPQPFFLAFPKKEARAGLVLRPMQPRFPFVSQRAFPAPRTCPPTPNHTRMCVCVCACVCACMRMQVRVSVSVCSSACEIVYVMRIAHACALHAREHARACACGSKRFTAEESNSAGHSLPLDFPRPKQSACVVLRRHDGDGTCSRARITEPGLNYGCDMTNGAPPPRRKFCSAFGMRGLFAVGLVCAISFV
jgi:hypothetical protein